MGTKYAGLPGGHYSVVFNFDDNRFIPAGYKYLLRNSNGEQEVKNKINNAISAIKQRLIKIIKTQRTLYDTISKKYLENNNTSLTFEDFLKNCRLGAENDPDDILREQLRIVLDKQDSEKQQEKNKKELEKLISPQVEGVKLLRQHFAELNPVNPEKLQNLITEIENLENKSLAQLWEQQILKLYSKNQEYINNLQEKLFKQIDVQSNIQYTSKGSEVTLTFSNNKQALKSLKFNINSLNDQIRGTIQTSRGTRKKSDYQEILSRVTNCLKEIQENEENNLGFLTKEEVKSLATFLTRSIQAGSHGGNKNFELKRKNPLGSSGVIFEDMLTLGVEKNFPKDMILQGSLQLVKESLLGGERTRKIGVLQGEIYSSNQKYTLSNSAIKSLDTLSSETLEEISKQQKRLIEGEEKNLKLITQEVQDKIDDYFILKDKQGQKYGIAFSDKLYKFSPTEVSSGNFVGGVEDISIGGGNLGSNMDILKSNALGIELNGEIQKQILFTLLNSSTSSAYSSLVAEELFDNYFEKILLSKIYELTFNPENFLKQVESEGLNSSNTLFMLQTGTIITPSFIYLESILPQLDATAAAITNVVTITLKRDTSSAAELYARALLNHGDNVPAQWNYVASIVASRSALRISYNLKNLYNSFVDK